MKLIFRYMAIAFAAIALFACSEKETVPAEPQLDVTPNNIAGTWKLSEWCGKALPEGRYFYIELIRRDKLFKTYENTASFTVHKETGYYNIIEDEVLGPVIRGVKDNSMGQEWNHKYVVSELTATRMVWVVTDNPSDVSVFTRSDIPEELL